MGIYNQYAGATRTQLGASYLDSRAILKIEEGYNYNLSGVGQTTEYIQIGNFEIEDMRNSGRNRQSLSISAVNEDKRLNRVEDYFGRRYDQHLRFYNEFNDPVTFASDMVVNTGTWGVTNGLVEVAPDTDVSTLLIGDKKLSNLVAVTKATSTSFATGQVGIYYGFQNEGFPTNTNYYLLRLYANCVDMLRWTGAVSTTLGVSIAFTPSNNTYYWLKVIWRNGTHYGYYSTNGLSYIKVGSYTDTTFTEGQVGLFTYGTTTQRFDSFDVTEIGNAYTQKEIIESAYATGSVGVSIQDEQLVLSGMTYSAGSSWTFGTSDNVFLMNTAGSSSWNALYTGEVYDDFVANVRVRGVSGNYIGMGFGGFASGYYMHFFGFGNTHLSTDYVSLTSSLYRTNNQAPYLNLLSDTWYDLKLVRDRGYIGLYINDVFAAHAYGTSFMTENPTGPIILGGAKFGVAGTTTEFSQLKVSSLDGLVGDVDAYTNSDAASTKNRVLPQGFETLTDSGGVNIIRVGSSRGNISVGLSSYVLSSDSETTNTVGDKFSITSTKKLLSNYNNPNVVIYKQTDTQRVSMINDATIDNESEGNEIVKQELLYNNSGLNPINISIKVRPDLEKFDTVSLVDNLLGVSDKLTITDFSKNFDFSGNNYKQSLTLTKLGNE